VLQVASAEFGSPISACSSLALAIEGVCSEPVQTLWSRLSRGRGARVCGGDRTLVRVMPCVSKTCLPAL
jgi:hypothetical protein